MGSIPGKVKCIANNTKNCIVAGLDHMNSQPLEIMYTQRQAEESHLIKHIENTQNS